MRAFFQKTGYEKTAIVMVAFSVLASAFNYLFQIVSGRLLSTADYGALNSAFSVVNIVTVLGVALGLSFAKDVSENGTLTGGKAKKLLLVCAAAAVPFAAALTLGMVFADYPASVSVLTSLAVVAVSSTYVFHAVLQGGKQFLKLSLFNTVQPAIKFVVGSVLLLLGFRYPSVLAVLFFGALCALLCGRLFLRKTVDLREDAPLSSVAPVLKFTLFTALSSFALTFFNNVDVLLVRRFFDAEALGLYSCASLFGKIVLYIPTVLVTLMFPLAAKKDGESRRVLYKTLAYSALLAVAAGVFLYILRKPLITFIMGETYLAAADFLPPLLFAVLPLVIVTVLVNYLLAVGDKWFVTVCCLVCAAVLVAGAVLFHATVQTVLAVLAAAYWALFVTLLIRSLVRK